VQTSKKPYIFSYELKMWIPSSVLKCTACLCQIKIDYPTDVSILIQFYNNKSIAILEVFRWTFFFKYVNVIAWNDHWKFI